MYNVIDYKPEKSFLRFIPQISTYGFLVREIFSLNKVYCISYNQSKAWLYRPEILLADLRDLLINYNIDRPWEKYLFG